MLGKIIPCNLPSVCEVGSCVFVLLEVGSYVFILLEVGSPSETLAIMRVYIRAFPHRSNIVQKGLGGP